MIQDRGERIGISVSIGVVSWPEAGQTVDSLMAAVDAAMYVSKRRGKNRVGGPEMPFPPDVLPAASGGRPEMPAPSLPAPSGSRVATRRSWAPTESVMLGPPVRADDPAAGPLVAAAAPPPQSMANPVTSSPMGTA